MWCANETFSAAVDVFVRSVSGVGNGLGGRSIEMHVRQVRRSRVRAWILVWAGPVSTQKMQIDADCSSYVFISVLGFFQQPVRVCMSLDAGHDGQFTNSFHDRAQWQENRNYQLCWRPPTKPLPTQLATEDPNEWCCRSIYQRRCNGYPPVHPSPYMVRILDTKGIEEGVYTDTVQAKFRYYTSRGIPDFPDGIFLPAAALPGARLYATMQVRVQGQAILCIGCQSAYRFWKLARPGPAPRSAGCRDGELRRKHEICCQTRMGRSGRR